MGMRRNLFRTMGRVRAVALAVFFFCGPVWASPFYPDDPYFFPDTAPREGYYGQWHLHNQMPLAPMNMGLDVNIVGAWARGLTGAGVVIGVIDDGVQGNHPDLEFFADGITPKFLNAYSWDFEKTAVQNWVDPYRGGPGGTGNQDSHGTAVAGVAAATGGNGIGVTGAAPHAFIASLHIQKPSFEVGKSENQAMVAAILYQGQLSEGQPDPYAPVDWESFGTEGPPIRIKNTSLGPRLAFATQPFHGAHPELYEAINESAAHRVIHVYAAGNERGDYSAQDSNKQYLQSHPLVINVAALGSDGKFSSYSSFGANVFVTAPSSTDWGFSIATTDRTGNDGYNPGGGEPYFTNPEAGDYNYGSKFGGTSSATPLVSGIMALGVQANPNMDVRMAQHLLVRTSRVVDAGDNTRTGGWIQNAAGHHFNNNYGFGLIDADAFTRMAAQVIGITEQTVYRSDVIEVNESFVSSETALTYTHVVSEVLALPLEYVRVYLSMTGFQIDWENYMQGIGAIVGDIHAILTSPSGTSNTLFLDDRDLLEESWQYRAWQTLDEDRNLVPLEEIDWGFTSFAYWGEEINGAWTLELWNRSTGELSEYGGFWESVSFEFGTGDIFLVPEPGTWRALLSVFLILMFFCSRRKSKATLF